MAAEGGRSVVGPGAYPKAPYGAFAGKPVSHPRVTILGPGGYPKALYASFAGKPASTGAPEHHDKPFLATVGGLMHIG